MILSGPPGTSKSYFAAAAAQVLAGGDDNRLRFVQFHASYQYEDFMLGFTPKDEGGFKFKQGPFLKLVLDGPATGKTPTSSSSMSCRGQTLAESLARR